MVMWMWSLPVLLIIHGILMSKTTEAGDPPTNVALTAIDEASLNLTWSPPQDGNETLLGYNILWDEGNHTINGNDTYQYQITKLSIAGKLYTVSISAIYNETGNSEYNKATSHTLPRTPQAPVCISNTTTTSLTFEIPSPPPNSQLDGYDVIITPLQHQFPYANGNITLKVNNPSNPEAKTHTLTNMTAGVTYNISVTSKVGDLSSDSINSSLCTTDLNVPLDTKITSTLENQINVSWSTPDGYYEGFNVFCIGYNSSKNATKTHNTTSVKVNETLSDFCETVTAGAYYEVNFNTILNIPPSASNSSASIFDVTVPFEPKTVGSHTVSEKAIQVKLEYGYNIDESQCTDYNISYPPNNHLQISCNETSTNIDKLDPDTLYNISVHAVSDYRSFGAQMFRTSTNAKTSQAWTLASPVESITLLQSFPFSLIVEFQLPRKKENVWQYKIHVNSSVPPSPVQTVNISCDDVPQLSTDTIGCTPDHTNTNSTSTSCKTQSEIKYEITGLTPYTDYSISVQPVNPGGCSQWNETIFRTNESIPGCVNISDAIPTSGTIDVTWALPDKPNGVIIHYIVYWNSSETNLTNSAVVKNSMNYTIHSLLSYSNYTVAVSAATSVGEGPYIGCPKSVKAVRTLTGAPSTPTLFPAATVNSSCLNITWTLNEERQTGPDTFFNLTITDAVDASWTYKEIHIKGFNNREWLVNDLDAYWFYNVTIVAYTVNETGTELTTRGADVTYQTEESVPGPVQEFTVKSLSGQHQCYLVQLTWKEPTERDKNGNLVNYTITWFMWNENGGNNHTTFNFDQANGTVYVIPDGMKYVFQIYASTSKGGGSVVNQTLDSTGFCRPEPIIGISKYFQNPTNMTDTPTTDHFPIGYIKDIFTKNANGNITATGLLVAQEKEGLNKTPEAFGNFSLFNESIKWSGAMWWDVIPEYRATPDKWIEDTTRKRRAESADAFIRYFIGSDTGCNRDEDVYCNGPLPGGRSYRIRPIICTHECYVTTYVEYIYVTKGYPPDLSWIAGVVIGVLALIALIAFLIYYFLLREKDGKDTEDRESTISMSPMQYAKEEMTNPVHIVDFSDYVADMHRNSDLKFNDEYQRIQDRSPKNPWTAAEMPENRVKNRFVNVLPYDRTRVKLIKLDDEDAGDYINANYISNNNGQREFIACQGPLPSTIDDFWQMIWEQNSSIIVMLTNLKEKGREKCGQYWPQNTNEPCSYGELTATMVSESHLNYYTIRQFTLEYGVSKRQVLQFHFIAWPDFGVPTDKEQVLDFVKCVRQRIDTQSDAPMIVHCSAGVGRTGTFITLDLLLRELEQLDDAGTIDIYGTVLKMREDRCYMVQTEAQYVFIHDCLNHEIEARRRQTSVCEGVYNNTFEDDVENVYANQGEEVKKE